MQGNAGAGVLHDLTKIKAAGALPGRYCPRLAAVQTFEALTDSNAAAHNQLSVLCTAEFDLAET